MRKISIRNKSIPANPRSDNYPVGSTVMRSSNGSTTIIGGSSGSPDIDILKTTDNKSATDRNVFSALRACAEFISKKVNDTAQGIIDFAQGIKLKSKSITDLVCSGEETELSDSNILSSSKTVEVIEQRAISRLRDDTTAGHITFEKGITTLNLLVQELARTYDLQVDHVATLFQTIIKDFVSSETFVPGMMGEGMKLYKALSGDWNLELDNVTVRKAITTFEMVIAKIRAVNGGLVVSAANGSVKSVSETTGDPAYYVLGIEGDMTFAADDLVRCQVFTSGRVKHYWLPIEQINGDSILLLKSGFPDGVIPAVGDELVQMGNRTDTSRQGVLYLTASEDGRPRFSVLDGINSPSLAGKNNTVLGCLDGITDTDLPADFQPSGYGLYSMNVFLKGIFILRNGKSIEQELMELSTQIEAIPGQISMKVTEEVGKMQIGGRNYVRNSHEAYSVSASISWQRMTLANGMVAGETYILSLQTVVNDGVIFMVTNNNNIGNQIIAPGVPFVLLEPKKYFAFTNNGFGLNGSFYNIKIEKGANATDWTPAPEDIDARMSQAELSLKPENIWMGIKSNVEAVAGGSRTIDIDARGLDENTYYPVIIHIPCNPMTTITLHYALGGVKPSWATHGSGFSVQIRWTTNGSGWGTIGIQRVVHEATQSFNSGNVAGNIGQITQYNKEYIYVRGGGYYHLSVEGTELSPHTGLYPNGYQEGGDPYVMRIDPISSVTFPVASIPAIIETGIDITNRKIVLSADKTVFRNNSGGQIAVFENDRIKADLIDARQIVVNGLNAGRVSTGNLDVTNGAKIGSFLINGSEILSREDVIFGVQTSKGTTTIDAQGINIFNKNGQVALNVQGGNAQISGNAFHANYSSYSFSGGTMNINNAMTLRGAICANVRKVYGSSDILDNDYFVACYNTTGITLYLPANPQIGRIIHIKRIYGYNVRVYGRGYQTYSGDVKDYQDLTKRGELQTYIFDGQYWQCNWHAL